MKVYFDLIADMEMASDGKPLKTVTDADGKEVEGLLYCECKTIADPNDDDEENALQKLDHLWFFEDINGDTPATYKKFKKWQKEFFAKYVKGLQKIKKERGDFKSDDDSKEAEDPKKAFQRRMNGIMTWVESEFENITFYNLMAATGEHGGKNYLSGQLFCWYSPGASDPYMCFMEDGCRVEKF